MGQRDSRVGASMRYETKLAGMRREVGTFLQTTSSLHMKLEKKRGEKKVQAKILKYIELLSIFRDQEGRHKF
jgi:hypothetical protein